MNAQLVNARTDAHEWADNYDRPVDDVFAIQSEIAKKIADQLQAKLSPTEKSAIEQAPTEDVAAFDLYTRAKTLLLTSSFSALTGQNYFKAVDLLDQALTRDPSFFLAQCQLAYAHDHMYFLGIDRTPARLASGGSGRCGIQISTGRRRSSSCAGRTSVSRLSRLRWSTCGA